MKTLTHWTATAALTLLVAVGVPHEAQASPIQYDFSYDSGHGILSGSLMGELQADNNTILISSVLDFAKFNGVAGPSLPNVLSIYGLFSKSPTFVPARTTLDGSLQDIYALDRPFTNTPQLIEGFALIAGLTGLPVSLQGFAGTESFGDNNTSYLAANWSITAAVPEPGSMALFGLALLGLAGTRRRRHLFLGGNGQGKWSGTLCLAAPGASPIASSKDGRKC